MNNPKNQPVVNADIPVLFDIVERGEFAPTENRMVTPEQPEEINFQLDADEYGSEDPTILPSAKNAINTEFNLSAPDATEEISSLPEHMRDVDLTEFTMPEFDDATQEVAVLHTNSLNPDQGQLIEQAIQKMMPQLEQLARETLENIIDTDQFDNKKE